MLARVMTFSAQSETLAALAESLRQQLPQRYGAIAGFRGLLVLHKAAADQVIAVSLWDDEVGLKASEPYAREFAQEVSRAAGADVAHGTYNVLGSIGIAPRP